MYRDFSDRSKNELLGLVSEVENEKLSNFTDWVGDRWYDFESWIGKLNIRNYLNNVNEYHKKVIDKNNTTKSSINSIFSKVKSVDSTYQNILAGKKSQLQQWQRYMAELNQIVNPANGKFSTSYMSKRVDEVLQNVRDDDLDKIRTFFTEIWKKGTGAKNLFRFLLGNPAISSDAMSSLYADVLWDSIINQQDSLTGKDIKTGLNFVSSINKNIGKYGKNEDFKLSSSIISYIATLCGIADTEHKSGLDVTSSILSLFKSSIGVESGLYNYYEKTLHPYDVAKLDSKFGNTMIGLKIASDIAGVANSGVDAYKVYIDPNSTAYDKAAETIKSGGSLFKLGGSIYIVGQSRTKTLQFVSSAGSKKAINQILATKQKLKYTTSSMASKNIKNVNAYITIGTSAISGIASGIKQYGKVSADGEVDGNDVGSIGLYGSLSGIDTFASSLTLGLIDFDSEAVAADMESDVAGFVQEDNWATNYIRDEDNWVVSRFAVSVGAGAYILGENLVEGVCDGAKTIGSWISTGWNTVTNLF